MKWLFVKRRLDFPRRSGHDVHTFEVMRALAGQGHEISLVTVDALQKGATDGLPLRHLSSLDGSEPTSAARPVLSSLQERFRSYWGIPMEPIVRTGELATELGVDATVVSGLDVLPLLGAVTRGTRVWYAGDEWVRHHLSLVRLRDRATWPHLKTAAVKGLYERAYAPLIDRAWVVTPGEAAAMRRYAGVRHVDVLPNGIDTDYFRPLDPLPEELPDSACFWGRLDFEPNIDAVRWFVTQVWPAVRRARGGATFTVYGFQPSRAVLQFDGRDGVSIVPDLPDLRSHVQRHQVVALPFVSGGGIKNKLLEAAAMARPIVASAVAVEGLGGRVPLTVCRTAGDWTARLLELFADGAHRAREGRAAREWVAMAHSWHGAALAGARGLEEPR